MRKFMVTVNGATYEVDVEEVGGAPATVPVCAAAPAAPAAQASQEAQAAPAAQPTSASAATPAAPEAPVADGEPVKAPMPGTILDVKVKAGDVLTKGETLVVLEAMKMENEIPAPRDGKVLQVTVAKGTTVNAGDTMVVLG